jgi:2,4-dienoyl-CoA reductase-like NADH-dependent reductase (Old Yellow Enzyme family)
MKTLSENKLFTPIQVGPMELNHRVVMAPLTRSRSVQPGSIPGDPRIKGNVLIAEGQGPIAAARLRKIFIGKIIAAGGFEPDTAEAAVRDGDADLVAFGRHFVANPDLPKRIRLGLPLNPYDRDTFYTFDARGYTDYPFHEQRSESLASTL